LKKTWILLFLVGFLEFTASISLREKPTFITHVYAGPQDPPKTAESERILSEKGLGTQEIPRSDGGKDKVYYSITTPDEERKAQEEEKEKADRSWDVLRNVIIDKRSR
jgi:hypothetical protein